MAFGVQDILKLLEQMPLWRALRAMPERMDALEERIRVLEAELRRRPEPEHCPRCQSAMKLDKVETHWMGSTEFHYFACEAEGCDFQRTRTVNLDPGKA